jgi:tetratricopeptide (TPR) repeat protein
LLLIAIRFLLSAVLVLSASAKLFLESAAKDTQKQGWTHFYLTDPKTLNRRAVLELQEGPARNLNAGHDILQGLLVTDAASRERWADFGGVLAQAGQIEKAEYCYLRAAQLAPNSAETLLSVAGFYRNTNQVRSALLYFGRILSYTAEFDPIVFDNFDTLALDFNEIATNGGMPPQLRPAQSYLRHLIGQGDAANARKAWAWIRPLSPDDRLAEEYVDFLLKEKLPEEAAAVWASQLMEREPGYGKTAFVINGDFEREPNGTLFDWRITPSEHVKVSRDRDVARSGRASLRIEFDGQENVRYQGVSQRVCLRPGTYHLEAFVRAAGITTDEGICLRVADAGSSHPLIETERVTGTSDWRKLERTFVVASPTRLVEIQVVRNSSLRFDSLVAGTAWIDQVSLARLN